MSERYFSLNEANHLVKKLQPFVKDAVRIHAELRRMSMSLISAGVKITEDVLAAKRDAEVDGTNRDLLEQSQAMYSLLVAEVKKIENTGAIVKGVSQGLLDFPTLLNGNKKVLLCWRLGEKEISAFHDVETGFDGRQPISGQKFLTSQSD